MLGVTVTINVVQRLFHCKSGIVLARVAAHLPQRVAPALRVEQTDGAALLEPLPHLPAAQLCGSGPCYTPLGVQSCDVVEMS